MISGWCTLKDRYAKHCTAPPLVVFVCRDQANAKEFCRAADPVVTAGHAYGGEYASEWDYPGRQRMLFVAERDVHEGRMAGYTLPSLPPEVRVAAAANAQQRRATRGNGRSSPSQRRHSETASLPLARGSRRERSASRRCRLATAAGASLASRLSLLVHSGRQTRGPRHARIQGEKSSASWVRRTDGGVPSRMELDSERGAAPFSDSRERTGPALTLRGVWLGERRAVP